MIQYYVILIKFALYRNENKTQNVFKFRIYVRSFFFIAEFIEYLSFPSHYSYIPDFFVENMSHSYKQVDESIMFWNETKWWSLDGRNPQNVESCMGGLYFPVICIGEGVWLVPWLRCPSVTFSAINKRFSASPDLNSPADVCFGYQEKLHSTSIVPPFVRRGRVAGKFR